MIYELEKNLKEEFPDIFSRLDGDSTDTCMAYGIEIGEGWYVLLRNLCSCVQSEVENLNRIYPEIRFKVIAEQIKEKFGQLTIYFDYEWNQNLPQHINRINETIHTINGIIKFGSFISARTCEVCGDEGKNTGKIYVKTLCKRCGVSEE